MSTNHDGISINPIADKSAASTSAASASSSLSSTRVDYRAMIRTDLEELATKYAILALTEKGINPRWIAAIQIAELLLR